MAVLLRGFPYDVRGFDVVLTQLVEHGLRVITPTREGSARPVLETPSTASSGQQAALAHEFLDLLDALGMEQAIIGGYDSGGRTACTVSAF